MTPEQEYRPLGPDDVIQVGDEFKDIGGEWSPVTHASIGTKESTWQQLQFRRPMSEAREKAEELSRKFRLVSKFGYQELEDEITVAILEAGKEANTAWSNVQLDVDRLTAERDAAQEHAKKCQFARDAAASESAQHLHRANAAETELAAEKEKVARLEKAFCHVHQNNGVDDACKICGLDLRDSIHLRIAKSAAALEKLKEVSNG